MRPAIMGAVVCAFRRSAATRRVGRGTGRGGVQVRLQGLMDGAWGGGVGERIEKEGGVAA